MPALVSISEYCNANLGGARKLQYVPTEQINLNTSRQIISDAGEWVFAVQLSSGSWLDMPVFDIIRWDQNSDEVQGVSVQEQRIRTTIQRMRPSVSVQLNQMEHLRFVLRLTDRNGEEWLIGDLAEGLQFRSQETTSDQAGLNAYTIEFSGLTLRKAAKYAP